jgi:hypothetical protein
MTRSTRAQWRIRFGFCAFLTGCGGAVVSALTGHYWLAAVCVVAALLSVAYLIVFTNELVDARHEEGQ